MREIIIEATTDIVEVRETTTQETTETTTQETIETTTQETIEETESVRDHGMAEEGMRSLFTSATSPMTSVVKKSAFSVKTLVRSTMSPLGLEVLDLLVWRVELLVRPHVNWMGEPLVEEPYM
eukprot:TRINITY_DN783_c0_g1_i4.p1 TRINITY_DN783_c0_g1~~TRINITY_DN783_c0_g1_i4.p1  ORF type:complete len:123 (+),score=20.87 TRINITY_DN783_c0_g1_i4:471-839(+)